MSRREPGGRGGRIVRERMKYESDFVTLPNAWLRDVRLSYKARGLLSMIMTHDAGWSISIEWIKDQAPDGRDAVIKGVQELEQYGYLERKQIRDTRGQMSHTEWKIKDPNKKKKSSSEPLTDFPYTDKPVTAKPQTENPTTIENHLQNLRLNNLTYVPKRASQDLHAYAESGWCTVCAYPNEHKQALIQEEKSA